MSNSEVELKLINTLNNERKNWYFGINWAILLSNSKSFQFYSVENYFWELVMLQLSWNARQNVPSKSCTEEDCQIVTNWLQHKNPWRHICPICAAHFNFCSKMRLCCIFKESGPVFWRKAGFGGRYSVAAAANNEGQTD